PQAIGRNQLSPQSPPSTFGCAPAAETTVPSCLTSILVACGEGLTNSYLRTCAVLSFAETPLTNRSAPCVVLVVATVTPALPSNGVKLAISPKPTMGLWSAGARYMAGPPWSAEPLENTLTAPGAASWPTTIRSVPPSVPPSQPVAKERPPL